MKTEKSYWTRLCEFLVRKKAQREFIKHETETVVKAHGSIVPDRPPMDVDENDRVLMNLREDDAVYRMMMNYAFTHVENNMAMAFDVTRSIDDQRDFKNRAAGVCGFITDIENTRARLLAEKETDQKREKKKG